MIIASIDIGSNTVLLLIADANLHTGEIIRLKDEQRLPRISQGLTPGGFISAESEKRLFDVLVEYSEIIKEFKCEKVLVYGTNALRIASNAAKIEDRIQMIFNWKLKILSGQEEAELAFKGTNDYGDKNKSKLVIDIGGGSTEIIFGSEIIIFSKSFEAGVVSISEKFLSNKNATPENLIKIRGQLKEIFGVLPTPSPAPEITIALAGTPVTLACLYMNMKLYDEEKAEGADLTNEAIKKLFENLSKLSPAQLLIRYPEIVKGREDLILSGSLILLYLMELLNIDKVIVSTKGIRYGAIYKYVAQLSS